MNRMWMALAGALAIAGCMDSALMPKANQDAVKDEEGKAEGWSTSDNPFTFGGTIEQKIASLPAVGEATNIPWAGNYWPVYQDSINHKWDGPTSDSPAKKYEKAFGGTCVEDAVSTYHGIDAHTS